MKLIRNIRKFFGNYDLGRKAKHITRNKRIYNFTTARTAGLIFDCRNEEEFNAVRDFKQFLESESIKTDVIGYVSDKQVPDHYLLRSGFNFFCQKDLTWYYKPDMAFTNDFLGKNYDILFDLSLKELFPVNYIVKLSPSSYKIGRFRETNHYDLMIDIKENKSVPYLIDQIKHYLSILHTKN
ncbi:DUF6913 domain-containing protein [Bacteroidota bacterium]